MTAKLRQQIASDAYVGMALVDTPVLEALDRVVAGPVRGLADFEQAELALRALVLHSRCSTLESVYLPGPVASERAGLLVPFSSPALVFSDSDEAIPPGLRPDLSAVSDLARHYLRAKVEVGGGVAVAASGPIGPATALMMKDRRATRVPVPALLDIVGAGHQIADRALRIVAGYLGGAGIFAAPAGRSAKDTERSPVGRMLAILDDWYDPFATSPQEALRPTLAIPPLLSTVLSRAPRRSEITAKIWELRESLAPPVSSLQNHLRQLNVSVSPAEGSRAASAIQEELDHLNRLVAAADRPLSVRLRNLAFDAAQALLSLAGGDIASALVAGVRLYWDAREHFPGALGRPTPSLGEELFLQTRQARAESAMAVAARHLSAAEIATIAAELDSS